VPRGGRGPRAGQLSWHVPVGPTARTGSVAAVWRPAITGRAPPRGRRGDGSCRRPHRRGARRAPPTGSLPCGGVRRCVPGGCPTSRAACRSRAAGAARPPPVATAGAARGQEAPGPSPRAGRALSRTGRAVPHLVLDQGRPIPAQAARGRCAAGAATRAAPGRRVRRAGPCLRARTGEGGGTDLSGWPGLPGPREPYPLGHRRPRSAAAAIGTGGRRVPRGVAGPSAT
jgi:hypothetical protein